MTGGIFLLLGYLNYTFSDKTFDRELFWNALIIIFSMALFLFPVVMLREKMCDWIYDKFGGPYENHEKFKNRFSKKTVTTIQIIAFGILIAVILVIILNG
ncbi:MAG: hypothetical protein BalsKO_23770 [Balneolaceae bacterium]